MIMKVIAPDYIMRTRYGLKKYFFLTVHIAIARVETFSISHNDLTCIKNKVDKKIILFI